MKIPFNFRTAGFVVIMGFVWSVPVGIVEHILIKAATGYSLEPPQWTGPYYEAIVFLSMLLLPFWSGFALKDQPLLRRIGWITFLPLLIALGPLLIFVLPFFVLRPFPPPRN